jgi:hypothetical protein
MKSGCILKHHLHPSRVLELLILIWRSPPLKRAHRSTVAEYKSKMKTLADDMASVGKKLDDEELCSYILKSLDFEYNSPISSIAVRVEPITLGELYSQLLPVETRLDLQNSTKSAPCRQLSSIANYVTCG